MTKKHDNAFANSVKCWICDNIYVDDDVKVRDHCHIVGKFREVLCIEIVISKLN